MSRFPSYLLIEYLKEHRYHYSHREHDADYYFNPRTQKYIKVPCSSKEFTESDVLTVFNGATDWTPEAELEYFKKYIPLMQV